MKGGGSKQQWWQKKGAGQYNKNAAKVNNNYKCSFEKISKDEYGLTLSWEVFSNLDVKNMITKSRLRYDWDTKTNILSLRNFQYLQQNLPPLIEYHFANSCKPELPAKMVYELEKPFPDHGLTMKIQHEQKIQGFKIKYESDDITKTCKDLLPFSLVKRLYDFQSDGVDFGIKNYGRVLIGDEMGVGKTVQALALATCYQSEWPCLILCPATLKQTWFQEIGKWLGSIALGSELVGRDDVQIIKSAKDPFYVKSKFVIVSYDTAKNLGELLYQKNFKVVICDEAHYLKSEDSKRT